MPQPASAPDYGELHRQLQNLERDARYTAVRVLKETERERTEEVVDPQGRAFVRKYITQDDDAFGEQYRTLQSLDTPLLPKVYDVYAIPGKTVVIMEKVEGLTLREHVQRHGRMPDEQARSIIADLCDAVGALHALKPAMIHRDLTPNNVMVTLHGAVPIDFGIARRFDETAAQDTRHWGTVGYAAPEQFGFGQSDRRTDVFALGMLYWFALTGRDPQPGLAKTIDNEAVPLAARRIIKKCIALDPAERYANVAALRRALGSVKGKPRRADAVEGGNSHPAQDSSVTHSNPGGHGGRSSLRQMGRTLLKIWQVTATIVLVLFCVIMLSSGPFSWRAAYPAGCALYLALVLCYLVFLFLPAYLILTDIGGVISRNPLLAQHRVLKIIGILFACFVLAMIASEVLPMLASTEYLQEAARQGSYL